MNKKLLKISLLTLGAFFATAKPVDCDPCNTSCESSCDSSLSCKGDIAGSFLFIRPNFQVGMPEVESFWRRRANNGECGEGRECGLGGAVQIVGFGGRSTNEKRLGRFFAFGNSNSLLVRSAQGSATAVGQVNPINFGIQYNGVDASFTSTISFRPRQSFAGVGFEWRQYLGWWNDCGSNWWFDISFPFEHIRNRVNLCESNVATTGTLATGAAANMTEAFAGRGVYTNITGAANGRAVGMQFGLIPLSSDCNTDCSNDCNTSCQTDCSTDCSFTDSCGSRKTSRNGVADVTLRLGYDALCTECCYVNGYVGVLAPTGNRPKGRLMFEPIIGHNRHVGFVFGSLMSYDIMSDCDRALSWEINFDSLYLFKGKETRSFDLRGHGPWSRYLLVYGSAADAADGIVSPGINYFTQEVNVTPRFWTSINSALVYNQRCGFAAELGWNFWAKQAERVSLRNASCFSDVRLVGLNCSNTQYENALAIPTAIPNQSNALNTIGNNNCVGVCTCDIDEVLNTTLPSNSSLIDATSGAAVLTAADLDLCSGANPAAMTNTVYGAIGYNFEWCVPMFVGVGGSYEFTPIDTALSRWTVWGKLGVSF